MRTVAWTAALVMLAIPLGGCLDIFNDDAPRGRTHEFTLEVKPGTSDTIALYTLNDGSEMRAVALGFSIPGEPLTVPNPTIRVKEGDTVILHIVNNNPLSHTVHLHGGLVPWEMDGVPYLTQPPIHPGEEFTYVFEDMKAGTYFYHCHVDSAHHIDLGMYGAFIVEEREPKYKADREYILMLDEWDNCHVHGNTDPITGTEQNGDMSERAGCLQRFLQDNLAQNQAGNIARNPICESDPPPPEPLYSQLECGAHGARPVYQSNRTWWYETHPVYQPLYNTFLINGKAFPDTLPLVAEEGETLRIRLINVGEELHSMHLHGHNMLVTHRDGYALEAPFRVDTLGIMPAERYDVIVKLDNPGLWMLHDHVGLNMRNDAVDPGGMMTCLAYDGFGGLDAFAMERSLECFDFAQTLFEHHHGGATAADHHAQDRMSRSSIALKGE